MIVTARDLGYSMLSERLIPSGPLGGNRFTQRVLLVVGAAGGGGTPSAQPETHDLGGRRQMLGMIA
jgi:hypothetical protein